MKKFLLSIFALLLAIANVQAEEYSYTFMKTAFSANGTKELSGVNWTLAGDGGYWGYDGTKGQQFGSGKKPYKSMTLSTSGISGTITKIEINTSGASSIKGSLNVTVGGAAFGEEIKLTSSATNYTFSGSASGEIILNYAQTSSKAIYIKSIAITYTTGAGGETTVVKPTFTPATGAKFVSTLSVVIAPVDGATIHYTTDGTDPTVDSDVYNTAIEITETTTVKAIAVKDGVSSEIATAEYTKLEVKSISEARSLCSEGGDVAMDLSGVQVVGVSGSNMFVQKDGVGICLYGYNPAYKAGDVFPDGSFVEGEAVMYEGLHEIKDYEITTSGNVTSAGIVANEVALADVNEGISCTYIKLNDVTFADGVISSGETTLSYYDAFDYIGSSELPTNACAVSGVLSVYKNNLQIQPVDINAGSAPLPGIDVQGAETSEAAVEIPLNSVVSITPSSGSTVTYTLGEGEVVEISEATEVLFDSEGIVALAVRAEQKFYTASEAVYYYNVVASTIPCNVAFCVNGTKVSDVEVTFGSSIESAPEVTAPDGLEFVGWTEDEATIDIVEFPYMVNEENVVLYAVYSIVSEQSASWNLVKDADEISAGDKIIIAAKPDYNKALGALSNSYHTAEDVTVSDETLSNTGSAIQLEVGKSGENYSFSYSGKYLCWKSESGNSLQVFAKTADNSIPDICYWTIEIDNDGVSTIRNAKTTERVLQYNAQSPRFACYSGTQQDTRIFKYVINEVLTTSYSTVTVSAAKYATFFSDKEVVAPESVTAYYITADNVKNGYVTLTEVGTIIPANTGVILYSDVETATEYVLAATNTGAVAIDANLLKGTVNDEYIKGDAYVLGNVNGIGLYKALLNKDAEGNNGDTHFKNNAGKAYLPVSALPAAAQSAQFYGFGFGGEGTTAIEEVKTENGEVKTIYDLTGRRVEKITEAGIYIVNGKKILVK